MRKKKTLLGRQQGDLVFGPRRRQYFFNLFKGSSSVKLRPGALPPEKVKEIINGIGANKLVEISRIGYDGQVDEVPMTVEIISVYSDGFSGRIVNVERDIIEASSDTLVYAKHGGGTIDFNYDDGDLKDIVESRDAEELTEARDIEGMSEIVSALDVDDHIIISYYDRKYRGTVNLEGNLAEKSDDSKVFTVVAEKINNVELEKKNEKTFDLDKELVIDISLM